MLTRVSALGLDVPVRQLKGSGQLYIPLSHQSCISFAQRTPCSHSRAATRRAMTVSQHILPVTSLIRRSYPSPPPPPALSPPGAHFFPFAFPDLTSSLPAAGWSPLGLCPLGNAIGRIICPAFFSTSGWGPPNNARHVMGCHCSVVIHVHITPTHLCDDH